ncbi:MAG: hypothetical protein ACI9FJ_001713 [Alteromonadaceae bacterium]
MRHFIKALMISCLVMAVLFCSAHLWGGLNIVVDDQLLEPALALGVVMVSVIVSLFIGALVIAGVLGSMLLVGGFFAMAAFIGIGLVFFSGLVISWPVIIAALVIWLLVREKPSKNNSVGY